VAQYHLSRGGQQIGVYPEEEMRAFFAQGRVAPGDLVWTAGMDRWQAANEVFGTRAKAPPKLHWAIVLAIAFVTFGFFYIVWAFVQATWVRRHIDGKSQAIPLLIGYVMLAFASGYVGDTAPRDSLRDIAGLALSLASFACAIAAFFSLRRSLLDHYNRVEPIGLKLNGVLTFFLNVFYFQHHFTRIAKMKRGEAVVPQ
jgi:hypothetical protein